MAIFLQLAPMQAMTDIFFMNTYHQMFGGFNEMMTPYLVASSESPIKVQNLNKYFAEIDGNINITPQLLSNDPDGFLHYAHLLQNLGFKKVNWNLGCPFPFVTRKQRGSGLLPFPERIEEILEKIMPELKTKLSVKIRLGLHHKTEILPIIDILNHFNVDEVIVHPRTAEQKYEGTADQEFFAEIYPKFNMPVVYNGDIRFKKQVFDMQKRFPHLKGYMIGRGAFINPFITNQVNGLEIPEKEKLEKFSQFYFALHHHYKTKTTNDIGFLSRMKEMWWYFSQSFNKGESYLFALKTINDVQVFEEAVQNIFTSGKLKI